MIKLLIASRWRESCFDVQLFEDEDIKWHFAIFARYISRFARYIWRFARYIWRFARYEMACERHKMECWWRSWQDELYLYYYLYVKIDLSSNSKLNKVIKIIHRKPSHSENNSNILKSNNLCLKMILKSN